MFYKLTNKKELSLTYFIILIYMELGASLAQSLERQPRNHKVPGLTPALANSAYE